MSLALPHCLEAPRELWRALQSHWKAGLLVGLARPEERASLVRAVHGPQGDGDTQEWPPTVATQDRKDSGSLRDRPGTSASDRQAGALRRPGTGAETCRDGAWGPALVIGSGGSSGGRRWCLQPVSHLEASAAATADWLVEQGIDPEACLHLNALPLHHISGLMPLVRAHQWGAEVRGLPPQLLRHPTGLEQACPLPAARPVLLSLVPTQLHRLLEEEIACRWLRRCQVIWVGGAALPPDLAERARQAALPLAPCYGATETAAMVCALPPEAFLSGQEGCGAPLKDVQIQLREPDAAVAVRTGRLSPGWFAQGVLRPLTSGDGWWRSGDSGQWLRATDTEGSASLRIRGRLDGAILSGGETVFPEQVRQRLLELIRQERLPVAELLLLGQSDALWGERLVALVRWQTVDATEAGDRQEAGASSSRQTGWLHRLAALARTLPPPQRPRRWLPCPELEPTITGKWERQRWRDWLATHDERKA